MNKSHVALKKTQRGATLIIALLLLVMIAMYGIPAAMNSMQNERMTGNTRQRDLAFQAAEATLRAVETWIYTQTAATLDVKAKADKPCTDSPDDADVTGGDGFLPNGECHSNDITYWRDTFNWGTEGKASSDSPISSTAIDGALVAAQPRYVVERMPNVQYCQPSGTLAPCTTTGDTAVTRDYYRVTTRGVGQDSNAIVILQTMYEFPE